MIDQIRKLLAADRRAAAIDIVYDTLDEHCLNGRFDAARDFIAQLIQAGDLPVSFFLSALIITKPWKEQLEKSIEDLKELLIKKNYDFKDFSF